MCWQVVGAVRLLPQTYGLWDAWFIKVCRLLSVCARMTHWSAVFAGRTPVWTDKDGDAAQKEGCDA